MGEKINASRVLRINLEGKRPLGNPSRRLEHNIEIYLKIIRW
jgi:hypothetical protein